MDMLRWACCIERSQVIFAGRFAVNAWFCALRATLGSLRPAAGSAREASARKSYRQDLLRSLNATDPLASMATGDPQKSTMSAWTSTPLHPIRDFGIRCSGRRRLWIRSWCAALGATGKAIVVPSPGPPGEPRHHADDPDSLHPRRLTCHCGRTDEWIPEGVPGKFVVIPNFTGPNDPYFGLPLWLQAPCCGNVLWAYNAEHLDLLERYVGARLRERGREPEMTMLAKLPQWIKSANNRDQVLKTIRKLRAST